MRNHGAPEDPPDVERFVREATIVVDTNVLLGLYRLSVPARDDALEVLESAAPQLWLPHQVEVEFYRNVAGARSELTSAYKKACEGLVAAAGKAKEAFGASSRWKDTRAAVGRQVDEAISALTQGLEALESDDAAVVSAENDPILTRLEAMFHGRVGPEPSPSEVRQRVEDFELWRTPNRIPPGFADTSKHTPVLRAGDYLLWCELLDHARQSSGPFLLLTNDGKADWATTDGAPRPELVAEFARHSPHGYHQVHLDTFVEVARVVFGSDVASETVEEIAEERSAASVEQVLRREAEAWDTLLLARLNAARRGRTYRSHFDDDALNSVIDIARPEEPFSEGLLRFLATSDTDRSPETELDRAMRAASRSVTQRERANIVDSRSDPDQDGRLDRMMQQEAERSKRRPSREDDVGSSARSTDTGHDA